MRKTDIFSIAKRRAIMCSVRRSSTAPELQMENALQKLVVDFRRNIADLPGRPDFLLEKYHLAIFVHGCFWHGHNSCRKGRTLVKSTKQYWREKIARNKRRDARVARKLRQLGFRVFSVWECELRRKGIPRRILTLIGA
jgi:DNA mismatch endonuclease (patch repair protein)